MPQCASSAVAREDGKALMGRLISFGEKKEQFGRAAHAAQRAMAADLDEMERRSIIIDELRQCAKDSATEVGIFEYKEKDAWAKQIVLTTLLSVPGASDLFTELEVNILQRAFLETMESEQFWLNLREQRWKL
jgi:hypothetical protein